jgi:putative intracellular protease/amidase
MTWFFRCASFLFALAVSQASIAEDAAHLTPPKNGPIRVAFIMSEGVTVIDYAGPWDVFETVHLGDDRKFEMVRPFELYTVAPTKIPFHTSGSNRPGMTILPDYDFSDAPTPDIIVVPAQNGGPGFSEWLQKMHAQNKIIMSVCTGAFKLAKAGLLEGKQATTHHWFFDRFATQYPAVSLVKEVRYVQADPILFTAGGENSGTDLALHIVSEYFGQQEAQNTADRMEYQGQGWKTNQGVSAALIPTWHEEWQGDIAAGRTVKMHIAQRGTQMVTTADTSWQHISGVPATIDDDGSLGVTVTFKLPSGNTAKFVAKDNAADDTLIGTYTQDGKSYPLTMTRNKVTSPRS